MSKFNFLPFNPSVDGQPVESTPIFTRGDITADITAAIERGDFSGDISQAIANLGATIQRNMTSSNVPVRENLEEVAKVLVPLDTPVRNMLPRIPGSGVAASWEVITSLGSTSSSGHPAGFFTEAGAPDQADTVYAKRTAAYCLQGVLGGVTTLAMSAGATFQNQLSREKLAKLQLLMLREENALINGDHSADGNAFDGLIKSISTNVVDGSVSSSPAPLTLDLIDTALKEIWDNGGYGNYILCSGVDSLSITRLCIASGTILRLTQTDPANLQGGHRVSEYFHPVTGEAVPVIASRYVPAGTIVIGSKFLPDGSAGAQVNVLPLVQTPLLPGENVGGYVAQEIAPDASAPMVHKFMVALASVLQVKSELHFAKITNVTAVA